MAWAIVADSDSRFELDTLYRFCRAYQRVQPLEIGELWAIAITLRVVLIENLTRLAAGIVSRLGLRGRGGGFGHEGVAGAAAQKGPGNAARAAEAQRLGNAFGAQLYQRLRDHDPETTPALKWLHRTFAAQGTAADDIVHSEHQRQGAANLSVRNVITSLRLISAVDWAKFFESVSLVDELMRERSSFAAFDFSTRDLYRHAIEEIARRSHCTEMDVARRALDLAQRAQVAGAADAGAPAPQHAHEPGYYLVTAGRPELERELGYRTPWSQRLTRGTRAAVAAVAGGGAAGGGPGGGPPAPPLFLGAAIGALAFLAASDIAVSIVN